MSDPKLISPMLDKFDMGDPISEHNGVRCCPAMEHESDEKYIVKIISSPASQTQAEAMLLSGAFADNDAAAEYYKAIAEDIAAEADVLNQLAQLEGFMPYVSWQIEPMEEGIGYDIYLLSHYRRTLQRFFQRNPMTHLGALNLGLDLCAALAVCRRMGYIYINLKPENIYLTDDQEYRIGDIGFIKLDSLKYASLPERYRSQYTAPEIQDAFSALNTTIDVYALGLILYQAFNNGQLPSLTEEVTELAPPAYADYEMAQIILKACAQQPEDRWQDPIEMGQALVSYMQRNGAHDTPIVPETQTEEIVSEDDVGAYECTDDQVAEESDCDDEIDRKETVEPDLPSPEDIKEEDIYTEDEEGNLTIILEDNEDETAPDQETIESAEVAVSEEVTEILNQADDLIAHPAPEPVIQPEPIEVVLPDPLPEDEVDKVPECDNTETENAEDDVEASEEAKDDTEAVADEVKDTAADELAEDSEDEEEVVPVAAKKKSAKGWIIAAIISATVLALLTAGFFFYKLYYLQTIDSLVLETTNKGELSVMVNSEIDESKLTVICMDAYGNQLESPVENGKAYFTGLAPNSAYTVKVAIIGFHRLTGFTTSSFTTPKETQIVQFIAVTGAEDGSVILSFTAEGPDINDWTIQYNAEDESATKVDFTGSMVTINGLTVGTEYTFILQPQEEINISGTNTVVYTASKLVKAEDLFVSAIADGKLTAAWSAPEGVSVESWTVRCYNDAGYNQTVTVNELTATFDDIDAAAEYHVEVKANGMSEGVTVYAPANVSTVTNLHVVDSDPVQLQILWERIQDGEMLLYYSIDGAAEQQLSCSDTSAVLEAVVPGAKYRFYLKNADGNIVPGGFVSYQAAAAENFSGYSVSKDTMEFMMCKTPSYSGWDRWDLDDEDYTTEFKVGQKASFLVHLEREYDTSSDKIATVYVIRDAEGKLVSAAQQTGSWSSLWYRNYGEFDIPAIPQSSGEYTIDVYFNGDLAGSETFTVK